MAKRCTRCHQWKEDSEFYKDKSKLDGLKSHCKRCHEAYKSSYRAKPGARQIRRRLVTLRTRAITWRPVFNDSVLFHAWRRSRMQARQASRNAYYRRLFTRDRGTARQWSRENPEVVRANRQARRAEERHAPVNNLTSVEWQWILEKYEFRCAYCGQHGQGLTPDHVIPLSRGGNNSLSNIVPACGPCNIRKGARTPDEADMAFAVPVRTMSDFEQLSLI